LLACNFFVYHSLLRYVAIELKAVSSDVAGKKATHGTNKKTSNTFFVLLAFSSFYHFSFSKRPAQENQRTKPTHHSSA